MRCAIYTRVSTDNQVEKEYNSIESQVEKIKSFINSQEKMEVFKVYSDPGFTGANLDRPGLQKMLKEIASWPSAPRNDGGNPIDMVIVYKMDRLTRSPKDFYHLIELFEQYNVVFISVTERFDTSTPSGRLLRNIMLTFAQFERELASERVKDKMLQRAAKGMWNGGTIPYGYSIQNKKLIINSLEANNVKKIYELYVAAGSLGKLRELLKEKRIMDRKGSYFPKNTLFFILRNIVYTGKIKYDNRIHDGIHPALITEKIFNEAQSLHGKKGKTYEFTKNYSLAGLIKCKECNSSMTPCHTKKQNKKKKIKYHYYRCTKTFRKNWNDCPTRQINAIRLETFIFKSIKRISLDKSYIDSLIFMFNSANMPHQNRHELRDDTTLFAPDIFRNTLINFTQENEKSKGIEKGITAKKYIKNIVYSKDEICVSLYYKKMCEGKEHLNPASGRVGAAAGRIPEFGQKNSSPGNLGRNEVVSRLGLEPSTPALKGRCSTG